MKKILSGVLISFIFFSSSFADCFYEEIEPECSTSWETYTSSCEWWSDTSSWYIPIAYKGKCDSTFDISDTTKEEVYEIMENFFYEKWYFKWNTEYPNNLNEDGIYFVNEKFFPAVISYINTERTKSLPNLKGIAILNYAVKTIWYDYYVSIPQ